MPTPEDLLRQIPAVERLLNSPKLEHLLSQAERSVVSAANCVSGKVTSKEKRCRRGDLSRCVLGRHDDCVEEGVCGGSCGGGFLSQYRKVRGERARAVQKVF